MGMFIVGVVIGFVSAITVLIAYALVNINERNDER